MGNCLKGSSTDDLSPLRNAETTSENPTSEQPWIPYREVNPGGGPMFYPSPGISCSVNQLSEEDQVKIAKKLGFIQHLPTGSYDGCKKNRECVICMIEFIVGDPVRYLPCLHIYHKKCIDAWLMRSFTCPSCMEPVDAALLTSYNSN